MSRFLLCAAILCALIWFVNFPSLEHTHRADQWLYLIDSMDYHSFSERLQNTYSYNRTRKMLPGDTALFRPVLFTLLCVELTLFGAHQTAPWQAASLVLHCLVSVLLLAVLCRLGRMPSSTPSPEPRQDGPHMLSQAITASPSQAPQPAMKKQAPMLLPLAITAFFSVNSSTHEQVIWAHMSGYMLYAVFFLGSLWSLLATLQCSPANRLAKKGGLACCWLLAVLGAFTYELGVVFAAALAVIYPWLATGASPRRRIAMGLLFGLIPVLYVALNWLDWIHRYPDEPMLVAFSGVRRPAGISDTINHLGRYLMFAIVQPFFPNNSFSVSERLWYTENGFSTLHAASGPDLLGTLGFAAGVLVLVFWLLASVGGVWTAWRRREFGRPLTLSLLGWVGLGAHVGMIVLGRMKVNTWAGYLSNNSYYPYLTFLMFIIATYPLMALSLRHATWQPRWRPAVLAIAFALLVLAHGAVVHRVNVAVAQYCSRCRLLLTLLREHVQGKSADYTFAIDYGSSMPVQQVMSIPVPTICFRPWMRAAKPTEVVALRPGSLVNRAAVTVVRPRAFPVLITFDHYYVFWEMGGNYHGILHWSGWRNEVTVFRLDRIHWKHTLHDATWEGLLKKAHAEEEELDPDD